MKLSDNVKEKLTIFVVFIIIGLMTILLGSIFTIGHNILELLLNKLGLVGLIIFLTFIDWLSNQAKKKEINKKEENSIPHNANTGQKKN